MKTGTQKFDIPDGKRPSPSFQSGQTSNAAPGGGGLRGESSASENSANIGQQIPTAKASGRDWANELWVLFCLFVGMVVKKIAPDLGLGFTGGVILYVAVLVVCIIIYRITDLLVKKAIALFWCLLAIFLGGCLFFAGSQLHQDSIHASSAKINRSADPQAIVQSLTPHDIYDRLKDRIFIITAFNSQSQPIVQGTGFLFCGRAIVTNFHVVRDAWKVTAQRMDKSDRAMEMSFLYSDKSNVLVNEDSDWAVLTWLDPNYLAEGPYLPPVPTSDLAQPGDMITVIGNPDGLAGTVSTGVVSARRGDGWIQIVEH